MKHINIAIIILLCLIVAACGGGAEKDTSDKTETLTTVASNSETITSENTNDEVLPDPDAIYETTAELVAAKSFLISQEYELEIKYQSDVNRQAYLSVCTDFSQGNSGITVNYNSCILRTPISKDFNETLTVANDKNQLVMAIWYFDDLETPRYETWENTSNVNDKKVFIVN